MAHPKCPNSNGDCYKMERFLKIGTGWRIGWNPHATLYPGLVGTDEWAIELTEAEFRDFSRLGIQLQQAIREIAHELMTEEKITCEVESELIWLEAEGYPDGYSLHLILQQGRRAEGTWSREVVSALFQALETLTIF